MNANEKKSEQNQLINVALEYLKLGFSPIPSRNKVPTLPSWKEYQTRKPTEEEVKEWFSNPKNQISLICGRISKGLVVIDFDSKDKKIVEAIFRTSFDELLRTTWVAETPHGFHIHFLCEEQIQNIQFRNIGVDIKSEGGLVVSPPADREDGKYINLSKPENIKQIEAKSMKELLDDLKLINDNWKFIQEVLEYYKQGSRDLISIGFSAFLKKALGLSLGEAKLIVEFIARYTNDEELASRLAKVNETYSKDKTAVHEWLQQVNPELDKELYNLLPKEFLDKKSTEIDITSIDKQQFKTLKSDLVEFISQKVKEERENINKLLNVCLSAYDRDPINVAIVAASSEGKSYLAENVVKMFPPEDTIILKSATPKAFTRERGYRVILNPDPNADEENKYTEIIEVDGQKTTVDKYINKLYADLELAKISKDKEEQAKIKAKIREIEEQTYTCIDFRNKVLLFLEEPIGQFWQDMLSLLSHDSWWTMISYVEGEGVKRTRKVLFRGWPAVIYCTSKTKNFGWEDLNTRFQVIEPTQTKTKYDLAVQQIFGNLNLKVKDYKLKEKERKLKSELRVFTNLIKNKKIYMFTPFDAEVLQKIFAGAEQGKVMRYSKHYERHIEMNALWNYYNRFIFKNERLENGAEEGEHVLVGNEDIEAVLSTIRKKYDFLAQMNGLPVSATEFFFEVVLPAYRSKRSQAEERQQSLENVNAKQEDFDLTVADLCDVAKSYCASNPSTNIKSSKVTVTRYLKILAERGFVLYENKDKSKTAGKPKIVIPLLTEQDIEQAGGSETVSQTVSKTISYNLKDKLARFDMIAAPCPKNETVSQTVSNMESIKYSNIEPEFKPLSLLTNSLSTNDIEKAILKLSCYTIETPTETVTETPTETVTETPTETVTETPLIDRFFELLNITLGTCETVTETPNSNTVLDSQPADQASNAATPQTPTKPADTPTTAKPDNAPTNPTAPDTTHATTESSTSPHSDTQVQANQQATSPRPAEPALDNYNAEQATQTQQQATLLLSRTTQQARAAEKEILATPQQQDARLKEAIQRVYNAICVAQRKDEPFWTREDLGQPNEDLFPALETLTTNLIEKALQTLERQGYIYQQKPNHWRTVRRLYIADIVYYNDPEHPVYCPNCGKPTGKLFWFGGDWVCLNCLAKKKSQRGE